MAILHKFPNGFEIHGGRMTKNEESEFYARIAEDPKVIVWGRKNKTIENRETPNVDQWEKSKKWNFSGGERK